MGNSAGKESRSPGDRRSGESSGRSPPSASFSFGISHPPEEGPGRVYGSRGGRNSRNDLHLFGSGGPSEREADPNGPRRETRQEREARKLEKERKLRATERERSLKDENIDGGYLVTLGTYVGPEDFSKPTVRRLQLERKLAPFWRGLNDHSNEWTEHQLVAAARGLPIPAPDEIPTQEESPNPNDSTFLGTNTSSKLPNVQNTDSLSTPTGSTVPHKPAFGASAVGTPNNSSNNTPTSLFLGRAKGFASLSPPKNTSQPELVRQEVKLPKDPHINGQPVEAYLYKDPSECPICFLYYPPFLNRTRCCDQPICSECFVQIKRPDPHPPEHMDPNSPPPPANENQVSLEEEQLQSEAATCPFCVMPEFGVTFDPPPFRRGLIYADQPVNNSPITPGQNSLVKRRRGQSVSATAPGVVSTDTVRPDWAKKLADARAHQARRSAAATALHTAAYMMNQQGGSTSFPGLGRRRRTNDGSGNAPRDILHPSQMDQLMAVLESQSASRGNARGATDLVSNRHSSRSANRPEDVEELMIMEAIRLSLQAEEERKGKEDKEAAKNAKKEEKQKAKEQKKAEKAAKKNAGNYPSSRNNSQFFSSSTNLPSDPSLTSHQPQSRDDGKGKGKAVIDERPRMTSIGFNPLEEPTSVIGETHKPITHDEQTVGNPTLRLVPGTSPATENSTANDSSLGTDFNFGSLSERIDIENDKNVSHANTAERAKDPTDTVASSTKR